MMYANRSRSLPTKYFIKVNSLLRGNGEINQLIHQSIKKRLYSTIEQRQKTESDAPLTLSVVIMITVITNNCKNSIRHYAYR